MRHARRGRRCGRRGVPGRRCGGAGTRRRAPTRSASGSRRRTRSSPASACARSSSRSPGERILEVGPGTGYYALAGRPEWIARTAGSTCSTCSRRCSTTRCAARGEQGIANIAPTLADARELSYPDDSFDARLPRDGARRDPRPGRRAARAAAGGEARGPNRGRRAVRRPAHGHALGAAAGRASAAGPRGRAQARRAALAFHPSASLIAAAFRPRPRAAWASSMLYAILICSDESCADEFEAWGEVEDFDEHALRGLRLHPAAARIQRGEPLDHRRVPAPHTARPAPQRGLSRCRGQAKLGLTTALER